MPEFDFGDIIGAQEERFAAQIWVYIPRKGHDARHEVCDIDSTVWEQHKKAIAESLAALSTGVTVTPDYEGGSIEAEGLVWERVALAYTYVKNDRFTLERVMRLRDALYRFGHETRQADRRRTYRCGAEPVPGCREGQVQLGIDEAMTSRLTKREGATCG